MLFEGAMERAPVLLHDTPRPDRKETEEVEA